MNNTQVQSISTVSEEESRPNQKPKVKGEFVFMKACLLNAEFDTPHEIVQWCKTARCRFMCDWCNIDINMYRRHMLEKCLARQKKKPVVISPKEKIKLENIDFGPLFDPSCNLALNT